MRQTTCSLVAVETSDRRTLLFTNPQSFRIAHADLERLSSLASSLSVPNLCSFKRLKTSSFNGSMGGTGRFSNKAIFSRIGKRSPRWWTQVLMSWHAGPLMTILVTLNRSRTSGSWSHCFATSVTSRIGCWHLRFLVGMSIPKGRPPMENFEHKMLPYGGKTLVGFFHYPDLPDYRSLYKNQKWKNWFIFHLTESDFDAILCLFSSPTSRSWVADICRWLAQDHGAKKRPRSAGVWQKKIGKYIGLIDP